MADCGIRVYALATELGVPPQAVLDVARRVSCDVRNQLSILDPPARAAVEAALGHWPPEDPTGVASKLRPKGPTPRSSGQT